MMKQWFDLDRIIIGSLLLFFPLFFWIGQPANDTYWLIKMGEYISKHGFPSFEPLSIHAGLRFSAQQWLASVIFYRCHQWWGFTGISWLMETIYIFIVIIVYFFSVHLSKQNRVMSLGAALLVGFGIFPFINARPQIFSYVLFLFEIILLERFIGASRKKLSGVGLVLISVLLINLHAAMWPLFFVIGFPYLLDGLKNFKPAFIKTEGYGPYPLLMILGLCFLVGFLNPYGLKNMFYLGYSYGNSGANDFVSEMQSPDFKNILGQIVFVYYLILIFTYFRRGVQPKLRYILLTLGTGYLSMSSLRNYPIFIIISYSLLSGSMESFSQLRDLRRNSIFEKWPLLKWFAVSLLICLMITVINLRKFPDTTRGYSPSGVVTFIRKNLGLDKVRLFNDYSTGGFLEFNNIRPFIDSRAEVFSKRFNGREDVLKDYIDVYRGRIHYRKVLSKYRLNYALVERDKLIDIYMSVDRNLKKIYQDRYFTLYQCLSVQ